MNYKLIRTETGRKSGKYHYQVVDETGKVISERNSNREYVACTIGGAFFFGRIDLIGKGDHAWTIKIWQSDIDAGRDVEHSKEVVERLTAIAYLH